MKTKFTILAAVLFLSLGVFAQAPEKINYQAVARDLSGNPMGGTTVNLQFDIIQASATVYSETQTLITNQFGLFTAEIGGGTVVVGNFSTIAWGSNPTSLQVTVNGDVMPSTQLLSVPYALYSKESANGPVGAQGPAGLGINWLGTLTTVPVTANLNDAYYNSTDGVAYIYDGSIWQIISQDGSASGDNWGTDVVNTSGTNISGDGTVASPLIITEVDGSVTNELQNLSYNSTDGNQIDISNGTGIPLSSISPTINQVLTWNGSSWVAQNPGAGADDWGTQVVQISGANITGDGTAATPLTVTEVDGSITNEIQDLSTAGNALNITGGTGTTISSVAPTTGDYLYWDGANWISQPVPAGSDNQDLQLAGNSLSLTNDATPVDLTPFMDNTDAQSLTYVSASQNLSISGGNSVTLVVDDADANATNEIQQLSFVTPNLTISGTGGNTVDLSTLITNDADWTVNTPDMYSAVTGNVGIGLSPVHKLDVAGDINLNGVYRIDGTIFIDNKSTSTLIGNTSNLGLSGLYNTFVGQGAGQSGTSGTRNTLMGRYAGNTNTTGSDNTLIGAQTVYQSTTATNNTAVGSYAGSSTTAGNNTFLGAYAGNTNTTGTGLTILGYNADVVGTGLTNATAIGTGALVSQSNSLILGNNTSVGIGTSTPSAKLDILASSGSADNIVKIGETGTTNKLKMSSGTTAYTFGGGNGSAIRHDITVNHASGNVGIGLGAILVPSAKLHLNGTLRLDNLGGAATPAAGLILTTTDALGNAEWQLPPAPPAPLWTKGSGILYQTTLTDNLGIGIATPTDKLHVVSGAPGTRVKIENTTNGWAGIDAKNTLGEMFIGVQGAADPTPGEFHIFDNVAGAQRMVIDAAGRVGIGTGNPSSFAHLNIENSIFDETVRFNNTNTAAGAVATGIWNRVVTNSTLTANATYGIWNGVNNQSNTSVLADATFANYSFTNNTGSGDSYGYYYKDFSATSTSYGVYMDGEDRNYFSGNVGIQIASPSFPLDVRTTSNIRGAYIETNGMTSTSSKIGVTGISTNGAGSGVNKGGAFNAVNGTAGDNYGVDAIASGGAANQRGVSASATGGSGINYGIYASATGGATNWAGYFSGDVQMTGNVGIGTAPNSKFHINETSTNPALRVQVNGTTQFIVANNGNVALNNNAAPAYKLHLSTNSAAKPTSNAWTVASDRNLKKDIKPFSSGLSDVLKINPVWFTYNGKAGMPNETGVGIIAQDLQKIAPYMVNEWEYRATNEETGELEGATEKYLGVDNGAMTYMLINAIKEQQKLIEELQKEVEALKMKQ